MPMELSLLPSLSPRHALPLRPASAAKRARRAPPRRGPGGGSPPSLLPPQRLGLAWPEGRPMRCPSVGELLGAPRFRRASSPLCPMASSTTTPR